MRPRPMRRFFSSVVGRRAIAQPLDRLSDFRSRRRRRPRGLFFEAGVERVELFPAHLDHGSSPLVSGDVRLWRESISCRVPGQVAPNGARDHKP